MEFISSRELAKAICGALGAPIEGCIGVEVDLELEDIAQVKITYAIPADLARELSGFKRRG